MARSVFAALAFLLAVAMPARSTAAQACGPLTFAFAGTGPGCSALGTGPVPTLSAAHIPLPGTPTCPIRFLLDQNAFLFPIPLATLVLGLGNPMLPIPSLPGCTAWTSADFFLLMSPDAGGPTLQDLWILVPPDPAFVGATLYVQGVLPVPVPVGIDFRISNGVRVDIL